MLALLEKIAAAFWQTIQRIFALVLPFLKGRTWFRGIGKTVYWILHFVFLAAVLAGLYWLNDYFRIHEHVTVSKALGRFWLPILFMLVYVLGWLGWWLWKLLGPEEDTSDFPDIDEAWEEAVYTLNQAGIDLREAPLFLVLGRTSEPEEALFSVPQLRLTVKKAPRKGDAPLHVYGSRDGVFITCPGASLLGRQASLLLSDEGEPIVSSVSSDEDAALKTLGKEDLRGVTKDIQQVLERARKEGRGPEQLNEDEREELRRMRAEADAEHLARIRKSRPALLKNPAEVDRNSRRLQRVCQLIQRDRRPYCPINGVLVLVPFGGTDSEEDANQTGGVIQYDLATVRRTFQMNYPLFAMVCDIERIPGFHEFAQRIPEDQRQRRIGQRFPLIPDLDADKYPAMVDGGVRFICSQLFPTWVYRLFSLERSQAETAKVVKGNVRLYQLMCQIRERQRRLSRILTRGIARDLAGEESGQIRQGRSATRMGGDGAALPMFGGCYLASASRDGGQEPAFVYGVLHRLRESQDYVSWTDDALAHDSQHHSWASRGFTILGLIALAAVAGVGYWIYTIMGKK